jgi:hypothetical protein
MKPAAKEKTKTIPTKLQLPLRPIRPIRANIKLIPAPLDKMTKTASFLHEQAYPSRVDLSPNDFRPNILFGNAMKALCFILLIALLPGCGKQAFQRGTAELIHYRTGPTTSTLLTGQDYKGISAATETLRYRNPQVALYDSYIAISYPGTDMKERVIPRDSLIELQWKK